ncbi:oligosaccharide flippase family protein [Aridibaculum aurantiacum]|uniref:oligosaccharide flippase family protein n=1 Tax=Aridibaculum aurantiacum TaxID=2810307 RepID=UPI001A95E9D7|nr:oligosaccharide flippase family protein [Aridibaculum aurantiacum]
MRSEKKVLGKNLLSLGVIQVGNYLFPLITLPIVTRIIGAEKFGILNFTASFVAYFTLLISFGFELTGTRRVAADPENEENRNRVFSEIFFTQCWLLLASVVIFIVVLFNISELNANKQISIFTFLTCLGTVVTQNWLFQAMQELSKVAILNFFAKLVSTILILFFIRKEADFIWQPLILSLSTLTVGLASFIWAIKRYKLRLIPVTLQQSLKVMWKEKMFFFSLCVISLYSNTSVIILGILRDLEQVGFYTAGEKLINIIKALVLIPFTQALFPYIGKAFGETFDKGLSVVQRLFPIVIFGGLISAGFIVILSPLVVNLLYGADFEKSINICYVLSLVPLLVGLNSLLGLQVMINLRMDRTFFFATLLSATVGLIFSPILSIRLGYLGPAFTWLFVELLNFSAFYIILSKKNIQVLQWQNFSLKNMAKSFN